MKTNYMILFITIQVLGFSLLLSKLPNPSEQTNTPNQFSSSELDSLKNNQQLAGIAATNSPELEIFRVAIRNILKEELATMLEKQTMVINATPFPRGKVNSENELPLTLELVQRRETSMMASRTIIEQAIAVGNWSMEDVSAMTPYVNDLSNSQRKELIELFLQNMGDKALSDGVPPPPL